MRWENLRRSSNVQDQRASGGGGAGRIVAGGGIGTIVLVVAALFFGVDPSAILGGSSSGAAPAVAPTPADDRLADFTSAVLASTEDVWNERFRASGSAYREPNLVLFRGAVNSACGRAGASVGPFYCPADQKAYIDLSFYGDLRERLGAPGDFAQAYVIAHEVGHHVQNLMGTSTAVRQAQRGAREAEANALSVRLELQADCYSGIWAHHADKRSNILEAGDVEEALGAASAIGDDTLQRKSTGQVRPDSFTHGTSAQRVKWFRTGLETGDVAACDTFAGTSIR